MNGYKKTYIISTITQQAGATFEGFGGIIGDLVIESGAEVGLTALSIFVLDKIINRIYKRRLEN